MTIDSVENEMRQIRKNMRGISPKLQMYKDYEVKLTALGQVLRTLRDAPVKPKPKGLLDFDESYVPVFVPHRIGSAPRDNFADLQNFGSADNSWEPND